MNRRGGLFRTRSISNRGSTHSAVSSQASQDEYSQSTMQSDRVQESAATGDPPNGRIRFARRSSLDLVANKQHQHQHQQQQQQQQHRPSSVSHSHSHAPKKSFFQRRGSLNGNTGPSASAAPAAPPAPKKGMFQRRGSLQGNTGGSAEPPPPKMGMFQRRGSLQGNTGGVSAEPPAPKMGMFQRRGSLQGNTGGGEASAEFTPPKMNVFQRRGSAQGNTGGGEQQPPRRGSGGASGGAGRMFRRASLGAAPVSSDLGASQPEVVDTASASSGPKGDAVPRPVSRRASIGEDTANVNNSAAAAALLDTSSAMRPVLPGFDFHADPARKIIMTEPPRRATRRSSVGPGINIVPNVQPTPVVPSPLVLPSAPVAREPEPTSPVKPHRKNKLFVNPFRRHKRNARRPNTTSAGGDSADDASSQASHSFAGGESESVSSKCSSQAPPQREIIIHPQENNDDPDEDNELTVSPIQASHWRPENQDIQEDEELGTTTSSLNNANLPSIPFKEPTVKFAPEPKVHFFDFTSRAIDKEDDDDYTAPSRPPPPPIEDDEPELPLPELRNLLWWNSEEMARIRQECMDLVRDFLDDSEYMDAVTKLFSSHKKTVSAQQVQAALEKIAQNSHARGLEMHICPRGGLLTEKHRRIVMTNVASTTVDGLSNTGEGWLVIRKESMKASRPCRQYALKMAEHDAMEAIEATMSHWSSESENEESESEEPVEEDPEQGPEDSMVEKPMSSTSSTTAKKKKSSSSSSSSKKKKKSSSSKTKLNGSKSSKNSMKKDVAPRTPRKDSSTGFTIPENDNEDAVDDLEDIKHPNQQQQQASGEASSQDDGPVIGE